MSLSKNIRLNLNPKIWGKYSWFFVDSIVLSYPKNPTTIIKQQYKNMFYSMPFILPCGICRKHFNQFITKYPLTDQILSSRDKLIIWILKAHNNVKTINKKKHISLSEFYSFYNTKYNKDVRNYSNIQSCNLKQNNNNKNDNNNIIIILFGIIIALSLYILRINQIKL